MYGFLADLMVAVHLAYVGYVVVGETLILLGWGWVRNFWFRATHLMAIAAVVAVEAFGVRCPLTVWEEDLRRLAGQPVSGETFVGRLFHYLLFYEHTPQWVFTAIHAAVGAVVLATFLLCPPRRPFGRGREHRRGGV